MSDQKFFKKEAISFGWRTMKPNFIFFAKVLLFVWLAGVLFGYIANGLEGLPIIISSIAYVGFWVLGMILNIGLIKIALDFSFNQRPKFGDLFSQYELFFKYLVGYILYKLIVLAGLILLIVPGIIWAIKFYYFPYFIVDKKMGSIQALKESSRITSSSKWNLFLLFLLLGLINIAGALFFGIGLLATIPTSMVAIAFVYHKLLVSGAELAKPLQIN